MLTPETVTFLEGGCSLIVGTVSTSGEPHATRGWGMTVLSTRPADIRLLLGADDAVAIEHLSTQARISITGADVRTLRSIQLKGTTLALEPGTHDDRTRAERYCDDFFGDVTEVDGTPRSLLARLKVPDYVACIVRVAELYDQTPGPAAGATMPEGTTAEVES